MSPKDSGQADTHDVGHVVVLVTNANAEVASGPLDTKTDGVASSAGARIVKLKTDRAKPMSPKVLS